MQFVTVMPTQPQALREQFTAKSTEQSQRSEFGTFVTTASSSKLS